MKLLTKNKAISLIFFSFLLGSCTSERVRSDANSNYRNEVHSQKWVDQFTGVASCSTTRKITYTHGLLSSNLGSNVECGDTVTLIQSNALNVKGLPYIGIKTGKVGGVCSTFFGYNNDVRGDSIGFWVYGENRKISDTLSSQYKTSYEFSLLRPKPFAVQTLSYFKDFLQSEENKLYVRLGGQGGEVIAIDKELAMQFSADCL